jgi:hypothetical protein
MVSIIANDVDRRVGLYLSTIKPVTVLHATLGITLIEAPSAQYPQFQTLLSSVPLLLRRDTTLSDIRGILEAPKVLDQTHANALSRLLESSNGIHIPLVRLLRESGRIANPSDDTPLTDYLSTDADKAFVEKLNYTSLALNPDEAVKLTVSLDLALSKVINTRGV